MSHVLQSSPIIPCDKWWAISRGRGGWGWSLLISKSEHNTLTHRDTEQQTEMSPRQLRQRAEEWSADTRDWVEMSARQSAWHYSAQVCPGCNKVNTGSERTNNFLLLTHKDYQLCTTGPPPLSLSLLSARMWAEPEPEPKQREILFIWLCPELSCSSQSWQSATMYNS